MHPTKDGKGNAKKHKITRSRLLYQMDTCAKAKHLIMD